MTEAEVFAKCQGIAALIDNLNTVAVNVSEKAKSDFEESVHNIDGHLGQIENILAQFNQDYESSKSKVKEKIDEAESVFNEQFESLKSSIDSTIADNTDLFEATKARLEATESTAQTGIDKINEINQSLDEEINALKDNVNEQFDNAEEYIASQCDDMDDAIQALTGFVEDCQNKVNDELEDTVQAFEEQVQAPVVQLTANIESAFESLRDFINQKIVVECSDKLQKEIMEPLEQEIDEVVESIQNYMSQFVANVISGGEDSKQSKQEMEASTQIIEDAISPVLDALDRVRGLAGTVGISI